MIDRILVVCQSKPESLKWVEILQHAIKQSRQHSSNHNSSNNHHVSASCLPPPQSFTPPYYHLTQWLRRKIISGEMDMTFLRKLLAVKQKKLLTPEIVRSRAQDSKANKSERILFPTQRPLLREDSGQFFIVLDGERADEDEDKESSSAASSFFTAETSPPTSFPASDIRVSIDSPTMEASLSSSSSSRTSSSDCWNRLGGQSLERICSVTRSLHLEQGRSKEAQKTNSAPPELDKTAKNLEMERQENFAATCEPSLQPDPGVDRLSLLKSNSTASASTTPQDSFDGSLGFIDSSSVSSSAFPFCPPMQVEFDEFNKAFEHQQKKESTRNKRGRKNLLADDEVDLIVVPVVGNIKVASIRVGEQLNEVNKTNPIKGKSTSMTSSEGGFSGSSSNKMSSFSTYVRPILTPVPSFETGCYVTSLNNIRLCCTSKKAERNDDHSRTRRRTKEISFPAPGPTYKSTFYAHWSMKAILAVDLEDILRVPDREVVI